MIFSRGAGFAPRIENDYISGIRQNEHIKNRFPSVTLSFVVSNGETDYTDFYLKIALY